MLFYVERRVCRVGNFCEQCGQLHNFCLCDDNPESNIARDIRERQQKEDYQDFTGKTNKEMTEMEW